MRCISWNIGRKIKLVEDQLKIIEDKNFLSKVLTRFNQKNIVFALDFRISNSIPFLLSRGWQKQTKINLFES